MIEQEVTADTQRFLRARERRRRSRQHGPTAQQLIERIHGLMAETHSQHEAEAQKGLIIELKNPSKKIVMFKPGSADSSERRLSREFFATLFDIKVGLAQAFLPGMGGLLRQDQNLSKQQLQEVWIRSADDSDRYVKGLKELSKKVREVVQNSEPLSYRDVANQLIIDSELYLASLEKGEREKQEKNIKRRVYDALNVLIASKILVKQGKKVAGNVTEGTRTRQDLSERIVSRMITEKLIEKGLQEKISQQEELQRLSTCVQLHFQRNRTNEDQCCVRGPLVAAIIGRNHHIQHSPNRSLLVIRADQPIIFLDEVEVARRLHL